MCLHNFEDMYLVWILALCLATKSEATKDKNETDKIEANKIDASTQTLSKLKKAIALAANAMGNIINKARTLPTEELRKKLNLDKQLYAAKDVIETM